MSAIFFLEQGSSLVIDKDNQFITNVGGKFL